MTAGAGARGSAPSTRTRPRSVQVPAAASRVMNLPSAQAGRGAGGGKETAARPGTAHSARRMSSTRSFASPKSIWLFSRKNSGFCTPA